MKKFVIGLMSGTSLDGLDICYVRFDTENPDHYKIIQAETIEYTDQWREKLKKAYTYPAKELAFLDAELGKYFGHQVNAFISRNKINKVDLIASHGQTVFHNPPKGYTTQIGHGSYINIITKIKTLSDFRYQDVALGGEGAPLVPIGDKLLFPDYKYCLNLGGFANISIQENEHIKAFDICPVNIVMNHYMQKIGKSFDKDGIMASKGKVNTDLLNKLNALPEYQSSSPKSFGWEIVEQKIIPLIDSYHIDTEDILRTYVEHVAMQIANKVSTGKMLVTGGGAFNIFLMKKIKAFSTADVIIPDPVLIDYKEALIFALLGVLKDMGRINILSEVTGAVMDHSSGVVYDAFSI